MNKNLFSLSALSAVVLAVAGLEVQAAPLTIANFSFEDQGAIAIANGVTPTGWTQEASTSTIGLLNASSLSAAGGPAAWSNGSFGLAINGATGNDRILQNTGLSLAANTTYTLQVDIAGTTNYQGFKIVFASGAVYFEGGSVNSAGRTLSYNYATGAGLLGGSYSSNLSNGTITDGVFSTATFTFTTAASITGATPIQIYLGLGNGASGAAGTWTGFDNVRLSAVPEPSVMGALSLAGVALAAYRIRRKATVRS